MTRPLSKKRSLVLAAVVVMAMSALGYAKGVKAEDGSPSHVQAETVVETKTAEQEKKSEARHGSVREEIRTARGEASTRREAAKARLDAAQLKRCQAKEKAITNIMTRIADRGQRQLDLFSTIANRVEGFYEEKGKTLNNYDNLVADVDAKKAAAQTAVDEIKATDTSFKCDGDNPHGVIDGFRESLKKEIAALKEYRTAVKNLIVGVKSAQSAEVQTPASEGASQ